MPEELVMACAAVLAKAKHQTAYPSYDQIQAYAGLARCVLRLAVEVPEVLEALAQENCA